jgi:PPOX class probable F420-dependent enzyme
MESNRSFAALAGREYLSLETLRKNGVAVRTPVWFAADDADSRESSPRRLFVYTIGETGKVKRIRNNPRVRVAPCDMRGRLLGEWIAGRAEIVTGEEAARGMRLLNHKYAPWKQLLDFFARFRPRERVVFTLRPE